jgi:predicted nucleic acid-binding protein
MTFEHSEIIIADTSCLIVLSKIGFLELLSLLFNSILITPEIQREFGQTLPPWIEIRSPHQRSPLPFSAELGNGEVSAIQLALETEHSLLILDDAEARECAARLQLPFAGTLSVLIDAKRKGKIEHVRPYIDRILNTNFFLSKKVANVVLEEAGEETIP